jgi:hypothetical protein
MATAREGGAMNVELCLRVCREVYAGKTWFLLERGTIVISAVPDASDDDVLQMMKHVDEMIGPHGGEGTPFGDCTPARLKAFDGWLVVFALPLYTFVGDDELVAACRLSGGPTEFMQMPNEADCNMQDLRVALYGRHKRNLDAKDPKIIARSTDP